MGCECNLSFKLQWHKPVHYVLYKAYHFLIISSSIKYKEMAFCSRDSSLIDYMFIQGQTLILFIPL